MREKNNLLVIILVILLIGLSGFIVYDKLIKKTEVKDCNSDNLKETEVKDCNGDNCVCDADDHCFKKHRVDRGFTLGRILITEDGDVYYKPSIIDFAGEQYNIPEYAKKLFGQPKEYTFDSMIPGYKDTYSYKLDLSDVLHVDEYVIGNNGYTNSLVFIHRNGNISMLGFHDNPVEFDTGLELKVNIPGYSNIVAASSYYAGFGHGLLLYDKCGNVIEYHG